MGLHLHRGRIGSPWLCPCRPPNNSLQLTRLACGRLERDLPAELRENGWTVARAAGQLSSRPLCAARRRNATCMVMDPISRGVLCVLPAKVEATESCRRRIVGGLYLVVRRARLRVAEDSGVLPEVSGGGERE